MLYISNVCTMQAYDLPGVVYMYMLPFLSPLFISKFCDVMKGDVL